MEIRELDNIILGRSLVRLRRTMHTEGVVEWLRTRYPKHLIASSIFLYYGVERRSSLEREFLTTAEAVVVLRGNAKGHFVVIYRENVLTGSRSDGFVGATLSPHTTVEGFRAGLENTFGSIVIGAGEFEGVNTSPRPVCPQARI